MAKKQSDKENRKDDNSVVASTLSVSSRELGDTPKPETKVCKRYKEQSRLETKMIEYLEKSSSNVEQPKHEEDVISLQMASLGEMICSSVLANKYKARHTHKRYTRFCLNTAKSKFSLVSPVAD